MVFSRVYGEGTSKHDRQIPVADAVVNYITNSPLRPASGARQAVTSVLSVWDDRLVLFFLRLRRVGEGILNRINTRDI